MARNKKIRTGLFKMSKNIRQNFDLLDASMEDIYKSTYYSSKDNDTDLENIKKDIDSSINNLMDNTYQNASIGNMTKIYTNLALKNAKGNKDIIDSMQLFNDEQVMGNILTVWMQNKWIKDLDYEIDMVLKYMPKLKEALNCKKDCVLSADHFAKDFVSYNNIINTSNEKLFNKRMEEIKRVYKLPHNFEEWYDNTQTYGEQFIYIAPYNKVFRQLLKNKANTVVTQLETVSLYENKTINESVLIVDPNLKNGKELMDSVKTMFEEANISNLTITLNKSGYLKSAIDELENAHNSNIGSFKSLHETYQSILESGRNSIASHIVPDDLKIDKSLEDETTASEMIIGGNKANVDDNVHINIPGCVVKTLPRENVIPCYIEDLCLGYYYIECKGTDIGFNDPNSFYHSADINTFSSPTQLSRNVDKLKEDEKNKVLNYLAGQLSSYIDANFINNNQDLRKELYMILNHNNVFNSMSTGMHANINITFIPADDIIHMKFNTDKITHRGVSDLAYSLFPAKLYTCLYITNVLGIITRGQDKRLYYVRQSVETNISKTLLNVINQIKKGNFGTRQMENLSNILNLTGRFNDFLIPTSASNDPPIQVETMPGQQFTDNSELMNTLEKMSIDPTGIPYDLIEARQSLDYAIQATMSNSKLMREVYKRQDASEEFYSDIVSKIYNYEYEENEMVQINLPAPSFLNMQNGSQLIEGTINYINTLTEMQIPLESDEVKAEFKKQAVRYYLPSHINLNLVDKWIEQARMNVKTKLDSGMEEQ